MMATVEDGYDRGPSMVRRVSRRLHFWQRDDKSYVVAAGIGDAPPEIHAEAEKRYGVRPRPRLSPIPVDFGYGWRPTVVRLRIDLEPEPFHETRVALQEAGYRSNGVKLYEHESGSWAEEEWRLPWWRRC